MDFTAGLHRLSLVLLSKQLYYYESDFLLQVLFHEAFIKLNHFQITITLKLEKTKITLILDSTAA